MQINELQINGFGNLKNKTIKLNKGINLIQGANESGKSTLTSFIKCMLYGVDKNKSGNDYSEYEKYKPWDEEATFSGSIKYEFQNQTYNLQRTFTSNSARIYNENNEEVTALFNKNKSRGLEIGFEQLGVDEETFINSSFIMQNKISVGKEDISSTIQKLTNIIKNGDENFSYEETKKKLQKILYDEVGTDRTATKPKYICKNDIKALEIKKDSIVLDKKRYENIEQRKKEIEHELEVAKKEERECTQILEIKQKYENEIQKEKMKFDIERKAREDAKKEFISSAEKKRMIEGILIITASILFIIVFVLFKEFIFACVELFCGIIALLINLKITYKEEVTAQSNDFDVISEEVRKKQSKEIHELERKGISSKYTEGRISELSILKEELKSKLIMLELDYHKCLIEEENINKNQSELQEIEADLLCKRKELLQLEEKEEVLEYAIENLDKAYAELKKEIIPEIEEDLKYEISKVTNKNYTEVIFSDEDGLMFKDINGVLQKVNKLSAGTIDQIYLGFRLAIANQYEEMPLIFDEAFVYFDDDRLENILKVISEIAETRQVLILSCSQREKQCFNKLGVQFNNVVI